MDNITTVAIKGTLDVDVTSYGISHPDYFQGHGTAFTSYDRCVTGCGDTEREALADAIDQMAQVCDFSLDDYNTPSLDKAMEEADTTVSAWAEALQEAGIDADDDEATQAFADESDGTYFYVGLSWVEPETDEHTASVLKTELEEYFNLPAIIARATAIRQKQATIYTENERKLGGYMEKLKAAGASIQDNDLGYLDVVTTGMQEATALPVNKSQVRQALSKLMDEHGLMLGEQPNGTLYAFEPYRVAVAQG